MITTDERKIIANVFIGEGELTVNPDGSMNWNPHFMERLIDYQQTFEDIFLDLITEKIGPEGWRIRFIQVTQLGPSFFCDVYADDKSIYDRIIGIVQATLTDIKIHSYWHKGGLQDFQ